MIQVAALVLLCALALVPAQCLQNAVSSGHKKGDAPSRELSPQTIDPNTGGIGAGAGREIKQPASQSQNPASLEDKEQAFLPAAPPEWANDAPTKQKYLQSLQGYYDYRRQAYEHRQRDFSWQHVSTVVIFIVVLLLVFSGIYFAYVQFHAGLKAKAQNPASPDEKSDIEISTKGLRVSSSVLGVIILGISLAFFYLYLIYVYPIGDTF
jgi:hypothetical protein